jgi:hypothetical protein
MTYRVFVGKDGHLDFSGCEEKAHRMAECPIDDTLLHGTDSILKHPDPVHGVPRPMCMGSCMGCHGQLNPSWAQLVLKGS